MNRSLLTYEVDDEPTVGAAAGGSAEEGFSVGREGEVRETRSRRQPDQVPGVGERVAEAHDRGVASAAAVSFDDRDLEQDRHDHRG